MEDFFCQNEGVVSQEKVSLYDCKIGQVYKIDQITQSLSLKSRIRLFEFGFVKGQRITLVKKSLLKKTLLVEIMNNVLSLRSDIAKFIWVIK